MNLFHKSSAVQLDFLIAELRAQRLRGVMLQVRTSVMVQGSDVEPFEFDLIEAGHVLLSPALASTAAPVVPGSSGNSVRLSVGSYACPDFKIDMDTLRVSGSVSVNQRPCSFDVPVQCVEAVLSPLGSETLNPNHFIEYVIDHLNAGQEEQEEKQEPEKPRPKLTLVK